jgi:hypothetical protein
LKSHYLEGNFESAAYSPKEKLKKEYIIPYEGEIINSDIFTKKYLLKNRGEIITLPRRLFRKDFEKGAREDWVVILDKDETRKMDMANLKGINLAIADLKSKECCIELDGWHEANHALRIGPSTFIDAEI